MRTIHITVPCTLRVDGKERDFNFNMEIDEVPGDVEIIEVKQATMEFIDTAKVLKETLAAYDKAHQAEIDAGHISEDQ